MLKYHKEEYQIHKSRQQLDYQLSFTFFLSVQNADCSSATCGDTTNYVCDTSTSTCEGREFLKCKMSLVAINDYIEGSGSATIK